MAGLLMQNSLSTLREENDDVPLERNFWVLIALRLVLPVGVRLRSVLDCDLRRVARRAVLVRGHQGQNGLKEKRRIDKRQMEDVVLKINEID
jgi:hypothetical protein